MKIPNYDTGVQKKDKRVVSFLPEDHRILICGQSACGKTNLLVHMIRKLLFYDKIYFITPNRHQPKMQDLMKFFDGISRKVGYPILEVHDENEIKNTNEYPHNNRKLVIFDDMINYSKNLDKISNHFTDGRHHKISPIFLSQSYFDVPSKLRQNCSHMILYPPTTRVHYNLISKENGVQKQAFDKLGPYEFLFIDKVKKTCKKNFDEPL